MHERNLAGATDLITICTVRTLKEQEGCYFFEKQSMENTRCMYDKDIDVGDGNICDSLPAIKDLRGE